MKKSLIRPFASVSCRQKGRDAEAQPPEPRNRPLFFAPSPAISLTAGSPPLFLPLPAAGPLTAGPSPADAAFTAKTSVVRPSASAFLKPPLQSLAALLKKRLAGGGAAVSKSRPVATATKKKAPPPAALPPSFLPERPPPVIVFFDGVCNLCGFFVHFILKRDKKRIFRYAPLQGATASRLLKENEEERQSLKQLVLRLEGRILSGFPAVQEIFCLLFPRLSWILRRIPGKALYRAVAVSRYRLFGKKKALYQPDKNFKHLFLP